MASSEVTIFKETVVLSPIKSTDIMDPEGNFAFS